MRLLQVSGKLSEYADTAEGEAFAATAILTERVWTAGNEIHVRWLILARSFQTVWMKKQADKGFTVVVSGTDFWMLNSEDQLRAKAIFAVELRDIAIP